eukprot:ANDGO_03633.mRNA.1 Divalent-cation tolerance protein CutA
MSSLRVYYVTVPSVVVGRTIGEHLVQSRIAACVNVIPGVESIYEWNGSVQHDQEALLMIKSTADQFQRLSDSVKKLHPYEVPEIIAVAIDNADPAYAEFVRKGSSKTPQPP